VPGYSQGMSAPIETLESQLVHDLDEASDRFGDERFCTELYRSLTNRTLSKGGGPEGHLVLSWNRAEEFVNELRARAGHEPLPLAQSGGEGVVSERVLDELSAHGWQTRPLNTARHDERQSRAAARPTSAG
jgi:hypothetical protein